MFSSTFYSTKIADFLTITLPKYENEATKSSLRHVRKRISRIIESSHRKKALENCGRVQKDRKVESSDLFSREEPASPAGVEIKPESRSLPLFDLEKFFHRCFFL